MAKNNLYLYPEFYFDQLHYFADLAIVQMDMGIEKEYIAERITDVAAAVCVSIPIAIPFMFMQKYYVEGMAGAVKG